MGSSNPRLSVPRDPPVWCEAETGSAVNITPELPAEQEETLSKHGRRRTVINPHPRMVGRSGRLGAATRVVPQRFVFRLCLLVRQRRFFTGEKSLIFLPKGLQPAAKLQLCHSEGAKRPWASALSPEGNGLPHRCAHWLAMTLYFNNKQDRRGGFSTPVFLAAYARLEYNIFVRCQPFLLQISLPWRGCPPALKVT